MKKIIRCIETVQKAEAEKAASHPGNLPERETARESVYAQLERAKLESESKNANRSDRKAEKQMNER